MGATPPRLGGLGIKDFRTPNEFLLLVGNPPAVPIEERLLPMEERPPPARKINYEIHG